MLRPVTKLVIAQFFLHPFNLSKLKCQHSSAYLTTRAIYSQVNPTFNEAQLVTVRPNGRHPANDILIAAASQSMQESFLYLFNCQP